MRVLAASTTHDARTHGEADETNIKHVVAYTLFYAVRSAFLYTTTECTQQLQRESATKNACPADRKTCIQLGGFCGRNVARVFCTRLVSCGFQNWWSSCCCLFFDCKAVVGGKPVSLVDAEQLGLMELWQHLYMYLLYEYFSSKIHSLSYEAFTSNMWE